jgi:hypothetical protein
MLNRISRHKSYISLCVLSGFVWTCCSSNGFELSQSNNSTPPMRDLRLQKTDRGILKDDGWEIPPLESMVLDKAGTVDEFAEDGSPVVVDYALYQATKELIQPQPAGFLKTPEHLVRIRSVSVLSVKGKRFAYSVVADQVYRNPEGSDYIKDGPGLVYVVMDGDGNGVFEFLKADSEVMRVPKWVTE